MAEKGWSFNTCLAASIFLLVVVVDYLFLALQRILPYIYIYISHMYKCWRNLSHDIESKHKNQFSGNNEAKPKFEVGSEQWRKCYMKVFVIVLL